MSNLLEQAQDAMGLGAKQSDGNGDGQSTSTDQTGGMKMSKKTRSRSAGSGLNVDGQSCANECTASSGGDAILEDVALDDSLGSQCSKCPASSGCSLQGIQGSAINVTPASCKLQPEAFIV